MKVSKTRGRRKSTDTQSLNGQKKSTAKASDATHHSQPDEVTTVQMVFELNDFINKISKDDETNQPRPNEEFRFKVSPASETISDRLEAGGADLGSFFQSNSIKNPSITF